MKRWFSVNGYTEDAAGIQPAKRDQAAGIALALFVFSLGLVYAGARSHRAADQKPPAPPLFRPQNHLGGSTSPYLLEHLYNPVDWYPWCPAALEKARTENRPIFLSVGYSACHWCHVMEREDFENPDIAHVMNLNYVCIKVDREERPDIDDQYQPAVQLITGSGGWPMSVWLTPDLKPFHAATYLPPEEFKNELIQAAALWMSNKETVTKQADRVAKAMVAAATSSSSPAALKSSICESANQQLLAEFDPAHGGFGSKPKFPEVPRLTYLLAQYRKLHRANLLHVVATTIDDMALGGIRDQLDGGFHRYSTDAEWQVPHFEKMLYDQALLADVYLDAYSTTSRAEYLITARGILDFVLKNMTDPATGGFYTSIDADSEGEEGKYYVWSLAQVEAALGRDRAQLFDKVYGVSAEGSFNTGTSVLRLAHPTSRADLAAIQPLIAQMLKAREKRVRPAVDDKIVCGLNGLMIEAMARGYTATGDNRYRQAAQRASGCLVHFLVKPDGSLLRTERAGTAAPTEGFLEDYAYTARAMLSNYSAFHDDSWLKQADEIVDQMDRRFWKKSGASCFASIGPTGAPVAASAAGEDNATPSANGVAAQDLLELARTPSGGKPRSTLEVDRLRKQAAETVEAFAQGISRAPAAYPTLLCVKSNER